MRRRLNPRNFPLENKGPCWSGADRSGTHSFIKEICVLMGNEMSWRGILKELGPADNWRQVHVYMFTDFCHMSVSVGDFNLVSLKRQRREMADGKTKGKEKRDDDEGHFLHSSGRGRGRNCVLSLGICSVTFFPNELSSHFGRMRLHAFSIVLFRLLDRPPHHRLGSGVHPTFALPPCIFVRLRHIEIKKESFSSTAEVG